VRERTFESVLHDDAVRPPIVLLRRLHRAPARALLLTALFLAAAAAGPSRAAPGISTPLVIDSSETESARLCPAPGELFPAGAASTDVVAILDDISEPGTLLSEEDDSGDLPAADDADESGAPLDPSAFDHAPYTLLPGYEPPVPEGGERSPWGRPLGSFPPAAAPSDDDSSPLPDPDKPYWRTNFFKRIFTDQAFLVTKWWPSEIKRWSFSGPLLGATFIAARSSEDESQYDFTIERTVHEHGQSGGGYTAAAFFTKAGNGLPAAAGLGLSYLWARHAGNDRLAEASSVSFEALLSTGLWVEIIKRGTARHRPTNDNNGRFFQYGEKDTSSFPSGHAAGAFTIATVFAHVYDDHKWVPWVAYGTATLIGASRVALGRHFPSDVIAGAVIGNSIGRMALTRDGRLGPLSLHNFQPIYDPKNKGFGVGYRYSW